MSSLKERLLRISAERRQAAAAKSDEELFNLDTPKPVENTSADVTTPPVVTAETIEPIKQEVKQFNSVVNLEDVGDYYDIKLKLKELEEALEYEIPGFIQSLHTIHKAMQEDPNIITIFSDEEIGLVFRALQKHTEVTITTTAPKSTKRTQTANSAPLTAADF